MWYVSHTMSRENRAFEYPTLQQWNGMLHYHPENTARSLYLVALDWHKCDLGDEHILRLVQVAENVLSELYPGFKPAH